MNPVVKPEKIKALEERMKALGIREDDIEEKFVRSRGPGGQKVNKTSTCVQIRHVPTNIEVKCGSSRSQSVNRYLARRRLVEKAERILLGGDSPVEKARLKAKKRKQRKKRRTKKKYNAP